MVEQQQAEDLEVKQRQFQSRGFSATGVLLTIAGVLLVGGIVIVVYLLATRGRRSAALAPVITRQVTEKVFIGKFGQVALMLRGPGGGTESATFVRASEARAIGIEDGEMIARLELWNLSEQATTLVDGEFIIRLGAENAQTLRHSSNVINLDPLRTVLAGGDPAAPLGPKTARRIGVRARASSFDQSLNAQLMRGQDTSVQLLATTLTERELADFDRMPSLATLDRWIARSKP